jgi:poly(3-hydroxyalkanoate) depolymerase
MAYTHERLSISFETIGNQVLRVAHWRAEADLGKRPLLFFNGIGANLELSLMLGELLPDRDILTFDVPGVGESPAPTLPYRPWQLARMARKLVDRFGYYNLDVMGVSWGGVMAQQFAIQYRKRVKRLILAATTTGVTMVPGKMASISKMTNPRRYADPDFMLRNFETLYGEEGGQDAQGFVAALRPPSPRGYMFQMLAFIGWTSLPFIRMLKMPTLVLAGDRDSIVPMANAHILNFSLPNSRLHVILDGGHLFLMSRAEETVPVIQDFLNEPYEVDLADITRAVQTA